MMYIKQPSECSGGCFVSYLVFPMKLRLRDKEKAQKQHVYIASELFVVTRTGIEPMITP